MQKPTNTSKVVYFAPRNKYAKIPTESISVLGIDTEADTDGKCFMICSSLGDVWKPEHLPGCLFDRKHRDQTYVAYNLKYDMGALIQHLPIENLAELRTTNRTTFGDYKYHVIANKLLSISKGHKYIKVYDMLNFYQSSLEKAAQKYLGEGKLEQDTKEYTEELINDNWDNIAEYCIKDAQLVQRLAERLIGQFETWGLKVRKLYSTAHVSYSWFSAKCGHPSVDYFWRMERRVLDMAMESYNGGKFEITTKGSGYFYEYDISSAYPYSIRNLVGLENARVVWDNKYRKTAVYGFLNCNINIPLELPSPVALKRGTLNTYPSGNFQKTITKQEYEYLVNNGADCIIRYACWIHVDKKTYPYREEIDRLYALKTELKDTDNKLAYHTIKILMNSLYGKFVQIIQNGEHWRAGASWNPIYASVITADTRVKISELQRQYDSIWAVHTDSIISDKSLPYEKDLTLGALSYETEGKGLIAGCGIYQIGEKTALRGVGSPIALLEMAKNSGETLTIQRKAPKTWRQVIFHGWDADRINRFENELKELRPNSDRKRLWIHDAKTWHDLYERRIFSAPLEHNDLFYRH